MPGVEEKLRVVSNLTESVCRHDNQPHLDVNAIRDRSAELNHRYEVLIQIFRRFEDLNVIHFNLQTIKIRVEGDADKWAIPFRQTEISFEEMAEKCDGELHAEDVEWRNGRTNVLQRHLVRSLYSLFIHSIPPPLCILISPHFVGMYTPV